MCMLLGPSSWNVGQIISMCLLRFCGAKSSPLGLALLSAELVLALLPAVRPDTGVVVLVEVDRSDAEQITGAGSGQKLQVDESNYLRVVSALRTPQR